jgi:hypothetical protein
MLVFCLSTLILPYTARTLVLKEERGRNSSSSNIYNGMTAEEAATYRTVTLDAVVIYEEALVDVSNWLAKIALMYAELPHPGSAAAMAYPDFLHVPEDAAAAAAAAAGAGAGAAAASGVVKGKVIGKETGAGSGGAGGATAALLGVDSKITMSGLLLFSQESEDRALAAIDGNIHAK